MTEMRSGGVGVNLALRRNRLEVPQRVLEYVVRGGHTGFCEPGREDAALGGAADMERLRHGAEVRGQAAGMRGRDAKRTPDPGWVTADAGRPRRRPLRSRQKLPLGCQPLA